MSKLPALERLDVVLNSVHEHQNPDIDFRFLYNKITHHNNDSAQVDGINGVSLALDKLLKDDFIKKEVREMGSIDKAGNKSIEKITWYSTTFEGEAFIEQGGYSISAQIDRQRIRIQNLKDLFLIIGTWLAGIGAICLVVWEIYKTFYLDN